MDRIEQLPVASKEVATKNSYPCLYSWVVIRTHTGTHRVSGTCQVCHLTCKNHIKIINFNI
jgi:hypothetical protein